jgi:hypothetical protein
MGPCVVCHQYGCQCDGYIKFVFSDGLEFVVRADAKADEVTHSMREAAADELWEKIQKEEGG